MTDTIDHEAFDSGAVPEDLPPDVPLLRVEHLVKEFPILVKADVQGSAEAIVQAGDD